MLQRDQVEPTLTNWIKGTATNLAGDVIRRVWDALGDVGAIGPKSRDARRFGSFGEGTVVCFPTQRLVNPQAIHLGSDTMIAPDVTLSAGWGPGQIGLPDRVLSIGNRCLIGRGTGIVAHRSVEIGDDVWMGHSIYITDMNHGYEDVGRPISVQNQPESPVVIGDGSWLGTGAVVLPGAHIGRHVVVGANSVVTGKLPDFSVAVGAPARVIKVHDGARGWVSPAAPAQGADTPKR